jgi:hypothetical protein
MTREELLKEIAELVKRKLQEAIVTRRVAGDHVLYRATKAEPEEEAQGQIEGERGG